MDNLVNYIAGAFLIILVVLITLLLFPFFPRLALFIVVCSMLGTAIVVSMQEETKEEDGVERLRA